MDESIRWAHLVRSRNIRVAADVGWQGAGGPPGTEGYPAADVVELQQVTWHGWRARDTRVPEHDPRSLLGFIEERDGAFEVMQLGLGFHWLTFSSLEEASAYLLRTAQDATAERMAGELSWIS
jgi:hypothetical protein